MCDSQSGMGLSEPTVQVTGVYNQRLLLVFLALMDSFIFLVNQFTTGLNNCSFCFFKAFALTVTVLLKKPQLLLAMTGRKQNT